MVGSNLRMRSIVAVVDGEWIQNVVQMLTLGPLVTGLREARCRHRASAERWASCLTEQSLTSAAGMLVDDEGCSKLVLAKGIVGSDVST